MTNNDAGNNDNERTIGQSILYWSIVYVITIPVFVLVTALIVRTTLTLGM